MFLLRADGMRDADWRLLSAAARVVLDADLGDLAAQLSRPAPWLDAGDETDTGDDLPAPPPSLMPVTVPPLRMPNGVGGFTTDGHEYVIRARRRKRKTLLPGRTSWRTTSSAPWSVPPDWRSTWAVNSRENRATLFANDPIRDRTGEAIYLRDDETNAVWGATPARCRVVLMAAEARRARHCAGITRY